MLAVPIDRPRTSNCTCCVPGDSVTDGGVMAATDGSDDISATERSLASRQSTKIDPSTAPPTGMVLDRLMPKVGCATTLTLAVRVTPPAVALTWAAPGALAVRGMNIWLCPAPSTG